MLLRDTKLYAQLGLLPEQGRRRFGLYLMSPYFNRQERYVRLLEVFEQHADGTEEEAFAAVYGSGAFDQNKFRKDCTALLKLLHGFLAQEGYQGDGPQQTVYFLRQLNALGENHYFPFYAEDAVKGLGTHAFDQQVALGLEQHRYDLRQAGRKSGVDLNGLMEAADLAHCCRKMELLYLELNYSRVWARSQRSDDGVKAAEDAVFLGFIASRLERLPITTRMHYHLYRCTADAGAMENYTAFREMLGLPEVPAGALPDLYTAAINYCIRRLNAGEDAFLRELFFLHAEMLKLGLLEPQGTLLSPQFKNIVVVAARLGEFAWARAFVEGYGHRLEGEFNHNAVNFGLGVVAYLEGEPEVAAPYFYRVLDDFADLFYGLDARVYLLRIHYETGNVIGLDSLADSFRMYLKRNKELSGERKANYMAFLRHIRRLAHIPAYDTGGLRKLHAEILQGKKIGPTDWLLAKVEALMRPEAYPPIRGDS